MYQIYQPDKANGFDLNESEVARLCKDIAENMGAWRLETDEGRHYLVWDKYKICFRFKPQPNASDRSNPRIEISFSGRIAEAPIGTNIFYVLSEAQQQQFTTKITVAIARGAYKIAEEIRNRLIPQYMQIYRLALEQWQKDSAEQRGREQLTDKLAAIIGTEPIRPTEINSNVDIGFGKDIGVQVKVNQYGHELKLTSVPPYLLEEILRLIAKQKDAEKSAV